MPPIIPIPIRPSTRLNLPQLLIPLLTPLRPLGRLILPVLLLLIAFLLRLMHGLGIVLGGRVHRHEFQGLRGGRVDELVLGACGDDDDVGCFDCLSFLIFPC